MKRISNIITAIVISFNIFGQVDYDTVFVQGSCMSARQICESELFTIPFANQQQCESYLAPQYFRFYLHSNTSNFYLNTYGHTGSYALFGPFDSYGISACEQISMGQGSYVAGGLSGVFNTTLNAGHYILMVNPTNCVFVEGLWSMHIHIASEFFSCLQQPADCKDCIGSFSPDPGKYILSAWVKGEAQNKNTSYENPKIEVSFVGSGSSGTYPFTPSGKIIDDWQRIDGIVTVPQNATDIIIKLDCQTGTCYFDDIRFVPINGSMISYVYDPVKLKLTAQLDERNYATFYEYDEEGKLIRVKKETERGIMTIQENRDNIHKK